MLTEKEEKAIQQSVQRSCWNSYQLLELKASPTASDQSGRSVLHDAAFFLEPEELKLLLDQGASPLVRDEYGETPAEMCQRLLAGNYRSDTEPRPWDDQWDESGQKRSPHNWFERIRMEKNLDLLR